MVNHHIHNMVDTLRGNASQHLSFAIFYQKVNRILPPPPKKQQHFTLTNSKGHCMATAMQRPLLFMFNH